MNCGHAAEVKLDPLLDNCAVSKARGIVIGEVFIAVLVVRVAESLDDAVLDGKSVVGKKVAVSSGSV